jgi:hypothetical protein
MMDNLSRRAHEPDDDDRPPATSRSRRDSADIGSARRRRLGSRFRAPMYAAILHLSFPPAQHDAVGDFLTTEMAAVILGDDG